MKAVLRLPTKDQYAFIELHLEGDEVAKSIETYEQYMRTLHAAKSLSEPEFKKVLDNYIWGSGTMTVAEFDALDAAQKSIIDIIRLSRARNKPK